MIESVRLRDFKSHADTVVRFHPGANALLGQNGAGKTSVLQAIGLCLFDHGKPGALVRKGAKAGKATVAFVAADGGRYVVERRVGAAGVKLMDASGAVLATGKGVYDDVKVLLGLEPTEDLPRLWEQLVGVPQGDLTAAFRLTAAPRRTVFDAILRVEEYKQAADGLKPAHDLAKRRVEDAERRRARLEGRLEGAEARKAEAEALAKRSKELERLVAETTKEADASEAALAAHAEARAAAEGLRATAAQAEKALAALTSDARHARKRLDEAREAQTWLAEHQERVDAVEAAQQSLEREAEAIRVAREALAEEARATREVPDLERRLAAARDECARLREQVAQAPDFEAARKALPDQERQVQDAEARLVETRKAHQERALVVADAHRTARELDALEAEAASLDGVVASRAAADALHEAEAERESTVRLADALDAQFRMLADGRVCPILDVTCPVADDAVDGKREARGAELAARVVTLDASLADLRAAAETERARNRAVERWAARRPRLDELRRSRAEAERVQQEELPTLEAAVQATERDRDGAKAALDATRQVLATEPHAVRLAQSLARQERTLADDEARLEAMRTRSDALAAAHEAHAQTDRRASEADALLKRESDFMRDVVVRRNTVADLDARAKTCADADAKRDEVEGVHKEARAAAEAAWGPAQESAYAEAEAAAREARAQRTRAETEARSIADQATRAAALVDADRRTAADLETVASELTKARRIERLAGRVRGLVKDLGPHVAERFTEGVSVAAGESFRALSGGRPMQLRWHSDYDVTVTDSDGHTRGFTELSGGEQVMAALAVRLSLLRSLNPVPFAVYDEPTINLDDEVRHNVARVLEGFGQHQILVVSHDDAFSEGIHNAVRLRKEGTATVVEEGLHA